jgi:hypothetical protein
MKRGIKITILAFSLVLIISMTAIASGAVSCVETSKVSVKGLDKDNFCCRLMQRSDGCKFIGGVINILYNYDKKTSTYEGTFPATHVCSGLPKAGGAGVYTNTDTISYCLANGFDIILS